MVERNLEIHLLCVDPAQSYESGCLVLPKDFIDQYGCNVPKKIYLHVGSDKSWVGNFEKEKGMIDGLHSMISSYRLNQYNLAFLQYRGGPNFNVAFFNYYAVDIYYSSVLTAPKACSMKKDDVQHEKLSFCYRFNVFNTKGSVCELKVGTNHLEQRQFTKILPKNEMKELYAVETEKFVDIGFGKRRWRIELFVDEENCWFGSEWCDFARATCLQKDDVCVFHYNSEENFLEVAIFNIGEITNYNPPLGMDNSKLKPLFLHIIDEDCLEKGEIVVPRVFMQKFGSIINDTIKLWMADNSVWVAKFEKHSNIIYGLQRMQNYYSVLVGFTYIFHYFGKSTFYLSIISGKYVDILHDVNDKLTLNDVVIDNSLPTFNSDCERIEDYEGEEEIYDEDTSDAIRNVKYDFHADYFYVTLKRCHFDGKSHGVIIPRAVNKFYESWEKGMKIMLRFDGVEWKVMGYVEGMNCRLGKGWTPFINENSFELGQTVKFTYVTSTEPVFVISL